ncbi:MAG: UDP-N-acetylglucosamine 1-carboxyvinyltransferase [Thermoleophilia bacterium]|nr:UDP-N-acetylglucosamine 1-carboxyvinyltransferase [Thermoleophilia bacterium]
MDKYVITGGIPLVGTVRVSGAKNSALKLMAASLLSSEKTVLHNVPLIRDVLTMGEVLREIGARVTISPDRVEIDPGGELSPTAPYELVRRMRASILVMGPLLARLGRARVAMPGGCNIGPRHINYHLSGLEKLGAKINADHGFINVAARNLTGDIINLEYPSMGATENLIMAASTARGRTVIESAAREPEIIDLAKFLTSMGARINGAGTDTIVIDGVESLSGATHTVIPDRVEAGTFMLAAAVTGGDVEVTGANPLHLEIFTSKIRAIGVDVKEYDHHVRVKGGGEYFSTDIATLPFPGFPTDLQAPVMVLLSLAGGHSIVTENVFENRFSFVEELNRLGACIRTSGHHAVVHGNTRFEGAIVEATDLRAGAALVLAGLCASGVTEVRHIQHIDRGYEDLEFKLKGLGADIERVDTADRISTAVT